MGNRQIRVDNEIYAHLLRIRSHLDLEASDRLRKTGVKKRPPDMNDAVRVALNMKASA
jgi:hypothetical protein